MNTQPKKILIIDDEPGLAKAVARALQRLGYDADHRMGVPRDLDAKHLAASYDLIVCDGYLGSNSFNGREFHDQLPPELQKRLIFYTGFHSELFTGLPNTVIANKPNPEGLNQAIERHLRAEP